MEYRIITCYQFNKIDFEPDLIIGFYQDINQFEFQMHYKKIQKLYPDVNVIGCSSESNIYDEIPHVDVDEKHICIYLFLKLNKNGYKIKLLDSNKHIDIQDDGKNYDAIILSSNYSNFLEDNIEYLNNQLGIKHLYGGIAGISNISNDATIFYNGDVYTNTLLLLLFDNDYYKLDGLSIHQFEPVGFELTVTKSKNNIIYELDNQPALKVLEDIIGHLTHKKIESFSVPFFLKTDEYKTFEESPLCSIQNINRKNNSISLYRYVKNNDKVKLSIPVSSHEQLKRLRRFHKLRASSCVAFVFNCLGVKAYLGMMEYLYLMDLKRHLNIPFIGFHSFGEIGAFENGGVSIIHNQTISLAILSSVGEDA